MRISHVLVAPCQSSQRNGLRYGERRVPPRPVFDARYFLAALALVDPRLPKPDELGIGLRVMALAQPRELLIADRRGKPPLHRKSTRSFLNPVDRGFDSSAAPKRTPTRGTWPAESGLDDSVSLEIYGLR